MASSDKAFFSHGETDTRPKRVYVNPLGMNASQNEPVLAILKKNLIYEEQARALAKQSKFFEATSCLELVEEDDGGAFQIGLNLLKAECYIQLGRENRANKSVEAVNDFLIPEAEIDVELLFSVARSLGSDGSFIRSVILLKIASEIYKNSFSNPNEIVDGISRCIQVARDILATVTRPKKDEPDGDLDIAGYTGNLSQSSQNPADVARYRVVIFDFGIQYMKEMLNDLHAVQGADLDKKILKEAWSATHVGLILGYVEDFDKSYKIRKQAIDAMDEFFGDRADHYRVYGCLLHNMATVRHNANRYAEALSLYERAIMAKEAATDYSGTAKELDIQTSKQTMEITRNHLQLA